MTVKPGDVLADKYAVETVLGAGGMGIVVRARHLHLKQRVALKFLRPALASNADVVARFLREAQNASTIKSEHVARVTDVGLLENGAPYLVMEYLEGRDLAALLREQGRLPIALCVDYVLQAMEAIAEAHRAGIVHRDLKPSNLFLSERADGSPLVKVLDFGISKLTRSEGDDTTSLARTAGLMGSPLYMSPEQIRSSRNVDERTDVWSLGVIVYELLAGTPPFFGEEVNGVLAAIVADTPLPLGQARGDVPERLEAVVMRCLEKKPQARPPGVAELAVELEPFGSPAATVSVRRVVGVSERRESAPVHEVAAPPTPVVAAPPDGADTIVEAGTEGAWTQRDRTPSRFRSRWVALSALSAAVAILVAAVLAFRMQEPPDGGTTASEPRPAPAAPNPARAAEPAGAPEPPANSELPAEPSVAPAPLALSDFPVSPPAASIRRPPAKRAPTRPVATAKPAEPSWKTPAPNVGDMIDERR